MCRAGVFQVGGGRVAYRGTRVSRVSLAKQVEKNKHLFAIILGSTRETLEKIQYSDVCHPVRVLGGLQDEVQTCSAIAVRSGQFAQGQRLATDMRGERRLYTVFPFRISSVLVYSAKETTGVDAGFEHSLALYAGSMLMDGV